MPSPLVELERRVADLERSRRRLRAATMGLVGMLLALASLGASQNSAAAPPAVGGAGAAGRVERETIVAEALHLVDDRGALRILISARAGISMLDERGRPRAVLSIDSTGPGLLLYGETSKAGGSLTVNRDGPALALRDNDGNTRALLAAIDAGPALILSDERERERVALMQRGSAASISVMDGLGNTTWNTVTQR